MQNTDLDKQSNLQLKFRMNLRKNMLNAQGTRHDVVDVFRTALWYALLEQRLSICSAYQMEKRIEPHAFGKNESGDQYHRNKWPAYRVGRHTPNHDTVKLAELQASGSAYLINHVLWDALRGRKRLEWLMNTGLRQLARDVHAVIYKSSRYRHDETRISRLSSADLLRLERRAGLDALAAQIIFLRLADEQGDREQALEIGESIYRVLLILSTNLPLFNLYTEFLFLFQVYVFPMAHNGHRGVIVDDTSDFGRARDQLHWLRLELEDADLIGYTTKAENEAMANLLHGKWGFHIQFALAAPIGLLSCASEKNADDQNMIATAERFRAWGWEMINTGGREVLPPPKLWDSLR